MLFLLSGFLLAYSLNGKSQSGDYTIAAFASHKTRRIFREYIPALILIALLDALSIQLNENAYSYYDAFSIQQFLGNAGMLQGMAINRIIPNFECIPFGSGRPLWTLSLEYWSYFPLTWFYLIVKKQEPIDLKRIILLSFFLWVPSEYILGGRGCGLGFVLGMGFLAYYIYDKIDSKITPALFVLSIFIYIGYGAYYKDAYTIKSFIIMWFILCLGLSALREKPGVECTAKRNGLLSFLAKTTFMLYMLHYSIIDLIASAGIWQNTYLMFTAGIVLSVLISIPMYIIFGEKRLPARLLTLLPSGRAAS